MSIQPYRRRLLELATALAVVLATTGQAQDPTPSPPPTGADDVVLVLEGDQVPRQRLAFPSFEGTGELNSAGREAAAELEVTLRQDLELTGIFEIQGPDILSVLELTGERDRDFELYRSLNNQVVLLGRIQGLADGRLALEGRLYDLKSGRQILGKLYRSDLNVVRRMAHTFSDEIALYFSGRRGIALTTIAFVSTRDEPPNKELFYMDYDGYHQRRVSGHKSITLSPDFSPLNNDLLYVSFFEGPPSIYRVEHTTGRKFPVLSDGFHNMSPDISPDGRLIAYSRADRGNSEIYVMPYESTTARRLTNSGGIDTNPAWSPTGREIAFTSSRSGAPQLYLMDAEGSNLRRLTFEGNYNDGAAWHPDGTRIAYASRERGGSRFDIALVEVVTQESRIITSPPGSHEAPTFSPDGRLIAFESSRSGSRQVWVMHLDGSNLRQVTTEGENFSPTWSSYPR